jgi:GGDEF domain-containing protein
MAHEISARTQAALLALFPVVQGRTDAPTYLVDQLVEAELHRRGIPDSVSLATHALALTQGSLMKEEYDVSAHSHGDGWRIDAIVIDPIEFTVFNMKYGFAAGDLAFQALILALKKVCPNTKIVRIHTDGFAILFGPKLVEQVKQSAVESFATIPNTAPWKFTVGTLSLTLVEPQNWQIIGPTVWAECERALFIAKRTKDFKGIQRRIEFNGRLPLFEE